MSINELDKFVRHFVLKSVQIIVQSRLGGEKVSTLCNPRGNDWFNLSINDIKDINEQTKKCLENVGEKDKGVDDTGVAGVGMAVKSDWRICCEISVKTNEGDVLSLEYWFITNQVIDGQNDDHTSGNQQPIVIYNIYNHMSLMLKSLISLTRATPSYKLSCKGQSADSYVVCYRVYLCECDGDYDLDTFLSEADSKLFKAVTPLGSFKSPYNELSLAFTYRTDMTIGFKLPETDLTTSTLLKSPRLLPVKKDHFKPEERIRKLDETEALLTAAFANSLSSANDNPSIQLLPEAPFSNLLKNSDSNDSLNIIKRVDSLGSVGCNNKSPKSDPIFIPPTNNSKLKPLHSPSSPGVYSSSGDSFVFVELKAPFANEEQHELGSFFTGPSPTFTASCITDSNGDVSELTVQLAELESTVQQWDSFVESICCEQNEEDLEEKDEEGHEEPQLTK